MNVELRGWGSGESREIILKMSMLFFGKLPNRLPSFSIKEVVAL